MNRTKTHKEMLLHFITNTTSFLCEGIRCNHVFAPSQEADCPFYDKQDKGCILAEEAKPTLALSKRRAINFYIEKYGKDIDLLETLL
jgi:hypothetical protein